MQAIKLGDRAITLTRTFAAARPRVFDALTRAEHLIQWMQPTTMTMVQCEVDLRAGGAFRYVFQRRPGRTLEVRGVFETVDSPASLEYLESYDFSPLEVRVATSLEAARDETVFRQTIEYRTSQERDDDFPSIATSAAELYAKLERYLATSGR
jgi:uncharacterized protein YndB with AHSA1/START domain